MCGRAIGGDHRAAGRLAHPGDLIAQISESEITGLKEPLQLQHTNRIEIIREVKPSCFTCTKLLQSGIVLDHQINGHHAE